jgi:hypothetical protein
MRVIARDGEALVFSSQEGASKPKKWTYRISCDGQFHQVPSGVLSCKYTRADLVEGEARNFDAKPSYWTREVSADGAEMRISTYKDAKRTTLKSIFVLDRVK